MNGFTITFGTHPIGTARQLFILHLPTHGIAPKTLTTIQSSLDWILFFEASSLTIYQCSFRWAEKGVDLEFKFVGFYQRIASGGTTDKSAYTGKVETTWKFDLGKVAGWKYWSSEIKAEWRFGSPALTGTGGINLVNTAGIIPAAAGSAVSVTAVNFTRIIPKDLKKGDLYIVSFGRYNLIDLLDEDFFAGGGTERFMNVAPIGPLTVLRQVPLITKAVTFATVKGGEPRFSFTVMDPNDQSVDPGLDTLFGDGVTFAPGYNIPTKYFGKT